VLNLIIIKNFVKPLNVKFIDEGCLNVFFITFVLKKLSCLLLNFVKKNHESLIVSIERCGKCFMLWYCFENLAKFLATK